MFRQLRRAAEGSVLETHPHYRTAIGVLGVTMPPILIVGWLWLASKVESSISAYYYTWMRDWFVGTLWVIGVFLFFYTYEPRQPGGAMAQSSRESVRTGAADAWLGKLAGVAAVLVALVPTSPPPDSKDVAPTIGMLHGVAAAVLFLCLSLFPLILFSQSRTRRRLYQLYGRTMLGLLLLIVGYAFAPSAFKESLAPLRPILVLETLLIVVFGASWFQKGREMAAAASQAEAKASR